MQCVLTFDVCEELCLRAVWIELALLERVRERDSVAPLWSWSQEPRDAMITDGREAKALLGRARMAAHALATLEHDAQHEQCTGVALIGSSP